MFGLLKLHGPILSGTDEDGNFGVRDNPYSWHRKHNMLYIDNPVGAGQYCQVIKNMCDRFKLRAKFLPRTQQNKNHFLELLCRLRTSETRL